MKRNLIFGAMMVLFAAPAMSHALSFSFVSEPGNPSALIRFDGDNARTITFPAAGNGFDFVVGNSSNGALNGLKGNIGGTFTVGAITINGSVQTAPVSGTGSFSIFDGLDTLTADLNWQDVFTFGTQSGLNVNGNTNLSNISYTGSNAGLIEFVNSNTHTVTLSTQFIPGKTLTQLMAQGAVHENTYSGTFNAVPEPATMAILGVGALALIRRRRSK
ncbi:MAG: PEP-CTERM sorting domain-containing protein [Fimbriimonadaceae bacterium]|nr:PEP-CTERM sorting domain-containing protein [Fimbriimonadaceae bacterium]